jgi:hypothetical protein
MADDNSVSHYLDFFRANLNGEKKPERFLGSNLQCCLHATALMAVKYLAALNKYTSFKGRQISLTAQAAQGICLSSQQIFFRK